MLYSKLFLIYFVFYFLFYFLLFNTRKLFRKFLMYISLCITSKKNKITLDAKMGFHTPHFLFHLQIYKKYTSRCSLDMDTFWCLVYISYRFIDIHNKNIFCIKIVYVFVNENVKEAT